MAQRRTSYENRRTPVWIDSVVTPSKKEVATQLDKKRRIVQTEQGERIEAAEKDAFLGAQNQVFDRQTVSRQRLSSMSSPSQRQKFTPKPKLSQKTDETKSLSQFGVPLLPQNSPAPDQDVAEWATPGTRAQDDVTGMKESDRTALNTREFVFYGYFQRIRERLDRAWVPILRKKLTTYYRSGRHLASNMEHTTQVMVVLNENGEIIRVEMVNESGVKDLDDAAVGAFNEAGPFPNPPKGIIDRNREVKIPWDFVLKS